MPPPIYHRSLDFETHQHAHTLLDTIVLERACVGAPCVLKVSKNGNRKSELRWVDNLRERARKKILSISTHKVEQRGNKFE